MHARKKKTVIVTTKLACVEREADAVIHFPKAIPEEVLVVEGRTTTPSPPGLEYRARFGAFLCDDTSTRSPKRV